MSVWVLSNQIIIIWDNIDFSRPCGESQSQRNVATFQFYHSRFMNEAMFTMKPFIVDWIHRIWFWRSLTFLIRTNTSRIQRNCISCCWWLQLLRSHIDKLDGFVIGNTDWYGDLIKTNWFWHSWYCGNRIIRIRAWIRIFWWGLKSEGMSSSLHWR